MRIYSALQELVQQGVNAGLIQPEDKIYARNQVLSHLGLDSFPAEVEGESEKEIPELLDELVEYAVSAKVIPDLFDKKEILASQIMNVFLARPSEVNREFYQRYENSPKEATEYFYQLSQKSNYIQIQRISKNIHYKADTAYGELDITINLSKPEKDPKQIALEKELKKTAAHYPECLLCVENEGYAGRIGHPARSNHRMIRVELANEDWYFQYSPYVYYNEHCILLSGEHRDMKIDRGGFVRLLEFVEQFPHYFIGSNADLPIVGGSILTHDHYQGGNYEFAMAKAEEEYGFTLQGFPEVHGATVKWPMSVIRLRSKNKTELVEAADFIFETWKSYRDPAVEIEAYTGETRHNTVTPIARMRDGYFELDLVLRNNRTTEEFPLGIFHPHADVHHIKKENIGLIEVMGLAVLPARLKTELIEVERFLLGKDHEIAGYHLPWAEEMKENYRSELTEANITEIVRKEVGQKFMRVLEDAGVFKRNEAGQEAFRRFTDLLART
ncbi:UDP-glucose--hexose-1-phosphate uridylyltransferase [Mesobacillus maritimus]|uniref:UDP-glucose--hexose-1-phosphate uridylyltransferase n=1 Tax=Mesobacillus maritimus TaxID=1643336 RepID=UPI00203BD9C7|nr:UDP-glucose--hexose-1-phosphate uridylyltransferase [Mesobacillus maritimus]MCM3588234.1 UDP-glucose--hexose-1-phosphate uridylyltransferase [Mesobacillus maritimus]